LTESVILGALGSVPGVLLAFAGTAALARFAPETSRIHTISVNAPVLLFACAAGILSGILFGLIPALQLSRRSSQYPERWGSSLPAQKRWGDRTLIALQVAFTVALLITGGLFARTVDELFRVDLGFNPERIISIRAAVPDGRTIPEISSTYERVLHRLKEVPGIADAGASWYAPFLMPPPADDHSRSKEDPSLRRNPVPRSPATLSCRVTWKP
jgi:putative ABC transport system permease protein